MNRLKDKVAVIYGNGTVGAAVAKALAFEGAQVFLAGRTLKKLTAIAEEITLFAGTIEIAQVDARDEDAVEQHVAEVIKKAGKIDISFNAVGPDQIEVGHVPLIELSLEAFTLPITTHMESHFITARAAARRMVTQGSGIILMHTAFMSRISAPLAGGRAPAWAAMESLCRSFSVECGPYGVRAVCLLTTVIPETPIIVGAFEEIFEWLAKNQGFSVEQFDEMVISGSHRRRLNTLKELTDAAIFTTSDEGSAITGTVLNLTTGMIA